MRENNFFFKDYYKMYKVEKIFFKMSRYDHTVSNIHGATGSISLFYSIVYFLCLAFS